MKNLWWLYFSYFLAIDCVGYVPKIRRKNGYDIDWRFSKSSCTNYIFDNLLGEVGAKLKLSL